MHDAEPVGSSCIVHNYNIGVSPATVRSEMVALTDMGYLFKEHSSAGRIPTNLGLRLFVRELMEEEPLGSEEEAEVKTSLFPKRFDEGTLMRDVLRYLSSETGYAALCLLDDALRFYGVSQLTEFAEMRDIRVFESLLNVLESQRLVNKIFSRGVSDDVCMIIGNESSVEGLKSCAFVFSPFKYVNDRQGYLGVVGPRRMRYSRVIPLVRFVKGTIENSVKGW